MDIGYAGYRGVRFLTEELVLCEVVRSTTVRVLLRELKHQTTAQPRHCTKHAHHAAQKHALQ